ncbi:MAG: hypothetical protein SGBAC_012707, partial [Bacillariaceae sp.]
MKTKKNNFQEGDDWDSNDDGYDATELQSNGSSAFGQVIVFIMVGFILLMLTTAVELQGGDSSDSQLSSNNSSSIKKSDVVATTSHRPVGLTKRKSIPQDVIVKEMKTRSDGSAGVEDANYSEVELTGDSDTSDNGSSTPIEESSLGPLPNINIKDAWLTDFARLREEEHSRGRHTYVPRGRPMDEVQHQTLINQWGSWTLVDDKERPLDDYYTKYTNRDIPRSEFPENAWQVDAEYLSKYLSEGLALVERAQDAILAEYGKTEGSFEERAKMFKVTQFSDSKLPKSGLGPKEGTDHGSLREGGWTTTKSWAGLKRRILHAIMTEDNFVFAMGGHSSAAGHGSPRDFASYNLLSLILAGADVDMLMWDAGMTEGQDKRAVSVMHRQGLLGGSKVPILWSLASGVLRQLHADAGVDVGFPGSAHAGIPMIKSHEQVETMPWAMRAVSE